MGRQWLQLKGDPSIRQQVFAQKRTSGVFDCHSDVLLDRVEELFRNHGVFHVMLHFSRNQMIVWLHDDPYNYRVIAGEEIFEPNLLGRVKKAPYPAKAILPRELIRPLLEKFLALRYSDDEIYLRTGSINIMNGSIGLNFSCDGTHYLDFNEFLASPQYEAAVA